MTQSESPGTPSTASSNDGSAAVQIVGDCVYHAQIEEERAEATDFASAGDPGVEAEKVERVHDTVIKCGDDRKDKNGRSAGVGGSTSTEASVQAQGQNGLDPPRNGQVDTAIEPSISADATTENAPEVARESTISRYATAAAAPPEDWGPDVDTGIFQGPFGGLSARSKKSILNMTSSNLLSLAEVHADEGGRSTETLDAKAGVPGGDGGAQSGPTPSTNSRFARGQTLDVNTNGKSSGGDSSYGGERGEDVPPSSDGAHVAKGASPRVTKTNSASSVPLDVGVDKTPVLAKDGLSPYQYDDFGIPLEEELLENEDEDRLGDGEVPFADDVAEHLFDAPPTEADGDIFGDDERPPPPGDGTNEALMAQFLGGGETYASYPVDTRRSVMSGSSGLRHGISGSPSRWTLSGDAIRKNDDRVVEAVEAGDIRALKAFLDRGGDVETRDTRLRATLLGWVARRGSVDVVNLLLSKGAAVMARDGKMRTPLHRACTGCHTEVVKVLLKHGADPNAVDNTRRSPLHRAARWGSPECSVLLLDAGADIEARDQEMARTPLHYASRSGGVETTLTLLHNGADVNAKTVVGNTALHLACDRGLEANVNILLDWGADAAAKNEAGLTPAEVAAPWVEDSVREHIKELFAKHGEENEDTTSARPKPKIVRPRPDGAAKAEAGLMETIREQRSSRAECPDCQPDLLRSTHAFNGDGVPICRLSNASEGAFCKRTGSLRPCSAHRSRSQPGEGGLPGLDGLLPDYGIGESRSIRGLASQRKRASKKMARTNRRRQQDHRQCCTVQ